MVTAGLIDSIQHENKCCCAEVTPYEVYIYKINSALDNTLSQFKWHGSPDWTKV